ncbi:cyclin-L1a isoform X1 [Nerophis lumbriciformis]|uniref:cyclin-L1a isoform X1 n=1 Tax=Nerophis lumbriciformis TaxID=546530 RepID=UPI002AE04EE6|nr:cyclin-L1-like isoform X1 [Nerophis lumbriciformis]XP_061790113.1 cyclin-L1-like isoform X1 [Nerophis lumbriciformis]
MAAGPLSVSSAASPSNDGILIGDKVYSEVYLTIDNSLIPEERLSPTPSMLDGLDLHAETDLRILGCELIQSAGILLRLPQVAMATGQVLFHRFFYSKSFVKHNFEIVAMACVNLASKIEEAPRRIRDVINVFHHLKQMRVKKTPSSLILDQNYINTKNQVIKAERRILKELGFCVHVKHPHKIIVMYLQVLECEKNQTLVQTAWNYMNDSLRTNVFVRFQAETIACACIYLAARALQIPLPARPQWYLLFGATDDEIKDICITTLKLYTRKKPNYEQLEKEVERRKMFLADAKLKAKGLNPDGTPALSTMGGFSPASKPSSPNVVKVEEKSPSNQTAKAVKKEADSRTQITKSPHNGMRKDVKMGRNSRSGSRSRSRTRSRSRSRSPRRHYNSRRSRSGTYSSRSRSRSHSRSPSPRRHPPSPLLPHLKSKTSHHSNSDSKASGRHSNSGSGHKRKRSRSRSPVKAERERGRERERGSFDLTSKKHKHERGGGHRGDRRERERSRSYERERERERGHKSKHHSSGGHSGHSRHRR